VSAAPAAALRVAHLDTGRQWRGGQAQILLLAEGLARRGVSNVLLAPPGPLLQRARSRGLETESWRSAGDFDLFALARAVSLLRERTVDVVHCHSARAHALGVPAARLAGARAVIVSRRVAEAVAGHPLSALKYRLPVDRYLCVSRAVMGTLQGAGVPEGKLALVPSGVSLSPPALTEGPPSLRALIGAPESAPVVVTPAALTPEKRHEDLLEAARAVLQQVPEARFVWLGEGPRRAALEQLRDQLGLAQRVFLLGFRPDARALMAQCTVAALASDLEGIATALIEAQADGVPVVATRVGGIPEVVQDGVSGRLVPARDPSALAAALIEVLTQPERARAWSGQARLGMMQFDIERTVDRTLEEYQRVLEAHARTA
jgi:glycosyltransferase involved in cell wall biosynthesis